MNQRWIEHFKQQVLIKASMSKDENTQVGAVIFSEEDKVEISAGWNDLSRGVLHLPERNQRPLKYKLTLHAEANAIINAARMGRATKGASIMVSMFPCSICAGMIINAGIKTVYSPAPDFTHVQYGEDMKLSIDMFNEVGIIVEHI